MSEQDEKGRTLLHNVARSRNPESIRTVLALFPESERLNALSLDCIASCCLLRQFGID